MRVHDDTSGIRPFIALQSIYQKPEPDHVSHVTYGTQVLSMHQLRPRQTGDGTPHYWSRQIAPGSPFANHVFASKIGTPTKARGGHDARRCIHGRARTGTDAVLRSHSGCP